MAGTDSGAGELEGAWVVGARHCLEISDVAFGGEGVGRVAGRVVFVPWVLVGEAVEVELTEVKRSYARARLLAVTQPSTERVSPRCRYFARCGGCQYQHIRYEEQVRLKHRQVVEVLERMGGVPRDRVAAMIPCPEPYGYRNRLMLRAQWHRIEQELVIGFLQERSRMVVDIEECLIAEPVLNEEIRRVRANPPPRGGLKVVLRNVPADWEVPRDSFFQNNTVLLPHLVERVRERVRSAGTRHLLDLYCGVGFFALELAADVASFVGVEHDRLAIGAARRNALIRGVTNGEFVAADAAEALPGLLARKPRETCTVLLDPPRVGCRPAAIELLRRERPHQVLYVSCHPATLARDLNALCRDGVYAVECVVPLDMFPQTQHVECVADLRADPTAVAAGESERAGEAERGAEA